MRESVFISVIDPEGRINKSEIPVQNTRTISLGREMGTNTVQLPFRFVSGRHGEITFEGNKIYYRDLNSSNGTIVESGGLRGFLHQTARRVEIQDGALLRISAGSENDSITVLFDTEAGKTCETHCNRSSRAGDYCRVGDGLSGETHQFV